MIRLVDLDPIAVADEVCQWVTAQIAHLASAVAVQQPSEDQSRLRQRIIDLVLYAKSGRRIDEGLDACLAEIGRAIYSAAHPDYALMLGEMERKTQDPEHSIDCAIRAALARQSIERGKDVPVGWLAPLAAMGVHSLRTYGSRGTLEMDRGLVAAREAKRWLGW